jgi:hypothetical protein
VENDTAPDFDISGEGTLSGNQFVKESSNIWISDFNLIQSLTHGLGESKQEFPHNSTSGKAIDVQLGYKRFLYFKVQHLRKTCVKKL